MTEGMSEWTRYYRCDGEEARRELYGKVDDRVDGSWRCEINRVRLKGSPQSNRSNGDVVTGGVRHPRPSDSTTGDPSAMSSPTTPVRTPSGVYVDHVKVSICLTTLSYLENLGLGLYLYP